MLVMQLNFYVKLLQFYQEPMMRESQNGLAFVGVWFWERMFIKCSYKVLNLKP